MNKKTKQKIYKEFLKRGCVLFKINDVNFQTKDYRDTFLFFDYLGFTGEYQQQKSIFNDAISYTLVHPFFVKVKNTLTEDDVMNILHMMKIYHTAFKLIRFVEKKMFITWDNEWMKYVEDEKLREKLMNNDKH